MSQVIKKFIGDDQVDGAKILLDNNQNIEGRNQADSADLAMLKLNTSDKVESAQPFVVNDIASLDSLDLTGNSWGGDVPGLHLDGNSTDAQLNGGGGIVYKDTVGGTQFLLLTADYSGAVPTPGMYINTGYQDGSAATGNIQMSTGEQSGTAGNSGDLSLITGGAAVGDSGTILLQVGTAGGTVGKLQLDPSAGAISIGQVWTATDTSGSGTWQTPSGGGSTNGKESFTLIAGDISNGYVDLSNVALANSIDFVVSGLVSVEATDYTVALTGGGGGNTRLTFSGHTPTLAAGDVVVVKYEY